MRARSGHTIVMAMANGRIKSKKRNTAFIVRSPASTSPTRTLAAGQVQSQVGAYGEKQTPL